MENQNPASTLSLTSDEGQLSEGSIPHESDTDGQAMGTGMGILPVAAQTVLMHRSCNHVSAEVLYLAIQKELTSGLCANTSSAKLTHLNAIDCVACTMAKSRYANHMKQNAELLKKGIERQRVPEHITPRGVHAGLAPYELIAIDLKTNSPPTRLEHTICMLIVCLYSMKRYSVSLAKKSHEFEAFRTFQSTIAEGFRTRRLRMDISGEQTSQKMIEYLVSKGIGQQLVPHANNSHRKTIPNSVSKSVDYQNFRSATDMALG